MKRANIVANKGVELNLTWDQFLLANEKAYTRIVLVSDILKQRQRKILGHVIRADREDPMFKVSFDSSYEIVVTDGRRVGRPRQHFLEENINDVFWDLFAQVYDEADMQHRTDLVQSAYNYEF